MELPGEYKSVRVYCFRALLEVCLSNANIYTHNVSPTTIESPINFRLVKLLHGLHAWTVRTLIDHNEQVLL